MSTPGGGGTDPNARSSAEQKAEQERKHAEMERAKNKGKGASAGVSPNTESSLGDEGGTAAEVERLTQLLDAFRAERKNIVVKNESYEKGRPRLKPVADMERDPTNPYSMLSLEHLINLRHAPTSSNMATTEELSNIFSDIEGLGVPTEHVVRVILQMVLFYADSSSSKYVDPNGAEMFPGGSIPRDSVHAVFNKRSTARKVARLYAPMVWNYMLLHKRPPADWQAMGFPYEARYAAFDFFDYVQNPAAIQPVEGLVRPPTPAERIAHTTHARLALDRGAREEHFGNYDTEITGGIRGPSIRREFRQSR